MSNLRFELVKGCYPSGSKLRFYPSIHLAANRSGVAGAFSQSLGK
ncbi:MAG TPA: hypothetical protein V6D25_12800 [Leptolyngbyaceae cyanobacterium]